LNRFSKRFPGGPHRTRLGVACHPALPVAAEVEPSRPGESGMDGRVTRRTTLQLLSVKER
jgi:hypothetical protein